jgi:hypothetical protein
MFTNGKIVSKGEGKKERKVKVSRGKRAFEE